MRFLLLIALAGCIDKLDERWQLDVDHVVAVRATPPQVAAGGKASVDALVAHADGPVTIDGPAAALVMSPTDMTAALTFDGAWTVTAPETATLRSPIPLQLGLGFARASGDPFEVTKTVWLGPAGDNPAPPEILVDGVAATGDLVVPIARDVALTVDVDPTWQVNWLTSCGTLHDDDQAAAILNVGKSDRQRGQLALVVRDPDGGVAWRVFEIAAP